MHAGDAKAFGPGRSVHGSACGSVVEDGVNRADGRVEAFELVTAGERETAPDHDKVVVTATDEPEAFETPQCPGDARLGSPGGSEARSGGEPLETGTRNPAS
jgi:hypothetical protein